VAVVARGEGSDSTAALGKLPHIRVGRLELEEQISTSSGDIGDVPAFVRRCGEGGGGSLGQRQHRRARRIRTPPATWSIHSRRRSRRIERRCCRSPR
jgi:hypothetical protein